MLFSLTDKCPDTVSFRGRVYEVDMAFNNVIDVITITNREDMSDVDKVIYAASWLVGSQAQDMSPADQAALYEVIRTQLIEQQLTPKVVETDLQGNPLPGSTADFTGDEVDLENAGYDLEFDATYIYTAFRQAYGIDLHRELGRLHWLEFSVLLRDLPESTQFAQIQQIRARPLGSVKDKKERAALKKQKKRYKLPGRKVVDPLEERFGD